MKPKILAPLYYNISTISGFGPHYTSLFKNFIGDRYKDLLLHLPTTSNERIKISKLNFNYINKKIIFKCKVTSTWTTYKKPKISIATVKFDNTNISIIYFNVKKSWFDSLYKKGDDIIISGLLTERNKKLQMVHPDYVDNNLTKNIPTYESIYSLTQGIHKNKFKFAIETVIQYLPQLDEWIDKQLINSKNWFDFKKSIKCIHLPSNKIEANNYYLFHERLAFDEALSRQLALKLVRQHKKRKQKTIKKFNGVLSNKLSLLIPYKLTSSQQTVLQEIYDDLNSKERMSRLLQGDVGSGKTIVAFFALLNVIEAGYQGTLMVPTEILAQQHFNFFKQYTDKLNLKIELLTGKNKNKQDVLNKIKTGSIDLIIGTHAIIQENVKFKNLGLVIIDEQHRFGVYQRLSLIKKSQEADFLVMTATPIPRTLILTNYGDMDISTIKEKPKNRVTIKTITVNNNKIVQVINSISRSLNNNEQIFWICPLIDESKNLDLIDVKTRVESLEKHFPEKVTLIHGKMNTEEKDKNLKEFINKNKPILVSTTVIEVGIDIPEANIMIIEHAERFGLSQLHQLRGRIGRGKKESLCILLYDNKLTDIAKQRLNTMKFTSDGFLISEKDLELRGPGELLGIKQSGEQTYKILDLNIHKNLIEIAEDQAKLLIKKNPKLLGSQGTALKNLLYLFDQDKAVELINI